MKESKGEAMKRFYFLIIAASMFLAVVVTVLGCGSANQYGGSFDIATLCGDEECEFAALTDVSLSLNAPLVVWLNMINNMDYETNTPPNLIGQTVRTHRVVVEYRTPNGHEIPRLMQDMTVNIAPDEEVTYPVEIFSYEQIEYVRDRLSEFPDPPFSVSCRITVFYDTTGGRSDSVERLHSIHVHL